MMQQAVGDFPPIEYWQPVAQVGWLCPACGEANAPFMPTCARGPHQRTGTSGTANCNCGSTAPCPIHPPVKPSITINQD